MKADAALTTGAFGSQFYRALTHEGFQRFGIGAELHCEAVAPRRRTLAIASKRSAHVRVPIERTFPSCLKPKRGAAALI
jgi:hypothetical protein